MNGVKLVGTLVAGTDFEAQLKRADLAKIDILEFRWDTFRSLNIPLAKFLMRRAKATCDVPLLLTIRSRDENGLLPSSDIVRWRLFEALIPVCDLVDIEIRHAPLAKKVTRFARRHKKKVIHSFHDFKTGGNITGLNRLFQASRRLGGDYFKAAVTPKNNQELEQFLAWGSVLKKPKPVLIAMGQYGLISRVIGGSFGSHLTYGHLGRSAVMGQPAIADIKKALQAVYA